MKSKLCQHRLICEIRNLESKCKKKPVVELSHLEKLFESQQKRLTSILFLTAIAMLWFPIGSSEGRVATTSFLCFSSAFLFQWATIRKLLNS